LSVDEGSAGIVVAKMLATETADRGLANVVTSPSQKAESLDVAAIAASRSPTAPRRLRQMSWTPMKTSQAAPNSLSARYIQGAATNSACTPKQPAAPQIAVPSAIPTTADSPARRE